MTHRSDPTMSHSLDTPLLDRELFFGNPQVADGKLSPDGKFISFMKPYRGIMNVWVKDFAEPFENARMKFDVRYYLVAILFIVFDLEIAFLFPWAVSLDSVGLFGVLAMGIFLLVLVVGFIYEWKKGALEWD